MPRGFGSLVQLSPILVVATVLSPTRSGRPTILYTSCACLQKGPSLSSLRFSNGEFQDIADARAWVSFPVRADRFASPVVSDVGTT